MESGRLTRRPTLSTATTARSTTDPSSAIIPMPAGVKEETDTAGHADGFLEITVEHRAEK